MRTCSAKKTNHWRSGSQIY